MADCMHDRDAKTCPYCPAMERSRATSRRPAATALPEQDDQQIEQEEHGLSVTGAVYKNTRKVADVTEEMGRPLEPKRTRRHSVDEDFTDDSTDDGLEDMFRLRLRSYSREDGEYAEDGGGPTLS